MKSTRAQHARYANMSWMMARSVRAALTAVLAAATVGCGTTATITTKDGSHHELEIVRSTPSELIVATRQGERPLPRDQIVDVDHPGKAALGAGTVLALLGAANLLGVARCESGRSADFCIGWAVGGGMLASGIGLVGWGAYVWTRSSRAAGGQQVTQVARLAPALLGTIDRPQPGATFGLSF